MSKVPDGVSILANGTWLLGNGSLIIPPELCTLSTCPLSEANLSYDPSLAGNVFYTVLFALVLLLQVGLGIRYRTWGFLIAMFMGLVLEIIGYISRIQMHYNPFTSNPFLIYLICLTIGPAFFSAAIYLCLARILSVYGVTISRFSPRTYTITFMTCDFISLLLQAIGGAIADTAFSSGTSQTGINIMVAGLAWQVASLLLFMLCCGEYAWRVWRSWIPSAAGSHPLRESGMFKAFLGALGLATVTVFIRSCFRVAELSQGFNGPLANNEVTFMVLEGGMISIAAISLTAFHPGLSFAGRWADANFALRKRKGSRDVDEPKETSHA